ncbi:MAG: serine/threonine protein kinase, partial [Vicinamibacterales bacterium]|nr:serine/threonine protein kinase [Vicinamibacterales bacterium]
MIPEGTRLGPYEIVEPIGAGGMGEVYRAHDARLGRDVAVKVLPRRFASDADRLHRFEQEARAAAALNHPNIVAVFDLGVGEAGPYVVSELLQGETLRVTTARGPMPPRRAVDLAMQIAAGLAAAHQRGIVHRDLKPDNVFVTTDGRAKILDFGLAKLTEPIVAGPGPADAPTALVTIPGMVLGTAGYMSPEQVRGEVTDLRTDIFALGAVFYEMLAGKRAFTGDSVVETMSAILRTDPPEFVAGAVPSSLDRIVRRCLEKNPAHRFQSAGDIAFALEAVSAASSTSAGQPGVPAMVSPPPPRRARRRPWRPVAVGAALLAAGAALGALSARWLTPVLTTATFRALTFDRLPVTGARFMPDGQTIVYSAAPHAYVPELFMLSPNVEGPRALGVTAAHLLSSSSRGELALIVDARH